MVSALSLILFFYLVSITVRHGIIATLPNYWRLGRAVHFKFNLRKLIKYDSQFSALFIFNILNALIHRINFARFGFAESLYDYVFKNYDLDLRDLDGTIITLCNLILEDGLGLLEIKEFLEEVLTEFSLASQYFMPKFSFENLKKSPVALYFNLLKQGAHCDYPMPYQLNFQAPATPIMEGIVDLHHDIMGILVLIFCTVMYTLIYFLYTFDIDRNKYLYDVTHNSF